jgi:AraC-like DNA-binding protein
MSKKRQRLTTTSRDAKYGIVVRSFAVRHSNRHTIPPHSHDWHQLIYCSEGVMWVHTAQGEWVVPPNRAVWVPAGIEHSIEMSGRVLMQTLYFATQISGALPRYCCAVNVSPLLRELIVHTVVLGTLDQHDRALTHLIGFLVDQLRALSAIPLQLPLPSDERAMRVVVWLKEHPDNPGLIKQMAKKVGVGARTLERLFQKETGMTFGKWRQQLRLLHALRLLANGRSVTAVALDVGYDSASAFIVMFKRILGATPHRYFASSSLNGS